MIGSHLLLILHKKIQFYIFMFEAWNVAKGRKVQGCRILSQGTVHFQGDSRRFMGSWPIVLVCVFLCWLKLFLYIMFPPPFLMTEKSFWTSEQQLLTSNWMRIFSLMSRKRKIYCSSRTRPKPTSLVWRDAVTEVEEPDAWRFCVGEWIIHLCPLFNWQMWNPWRINWMSSAWGYPIAFCQQQLVRDP